MTTKRWQLRFFGFVMIMVASLTASGFGFEVAVRFALFGLIWVFVSDKLNIVFKNHFNARIATGLSIATTIFLYFILQIIIQTRVSFTLEPGIGTLTIFAAILYLFAFSPLEKAWDRYVEARQQNKSSIPTQTEENT